MGTVDRTGGATVVTGRPAKGLDMFYTLERQISFATTSCSAADVIQCLDIPAETWVFNVLIEVDTAEGATCTATVGDGDGAAAWDASTDLNATAGTITYGAGASDSYSTYGKFYSSADTIDLTMGHDTDAAIITIRATCCAVTAQA